MGYAFVGVGIQGLGVEGFGGLGFRVGACKVTSTNGTQIYSEASRSFGVLSLKGFSFSCEPDTSVVGCSLLGVTAVIKKLILQQPL